MLYYSRCQKTSLGPPMSTLICLPRLRTPSPGLDLWQAQRTLERGDFIEVTLAPEDSCSWRSPPDGPFPQGVLTFLPPGPSVQCHPVGLTPGGGHLLGPHTGRPLPWL